MKLFYDKPGKEMFVRTLPMGSGLMGAMVCPDPSEERIVINHAWMWRHFKTYGMENPECAHWLPYLRKLYFSGRKKEAGDLANKVLGSQARSRKSFFENDPRHVEHLGLDPTDGIYGPDPFVPVGEVHIHFEKTKEEKEFCSSLELDTGEAMVVSGTGKTRIVQKAIVSRNQDALIVQITSETPMDGFVFLTRVEDEDCELTDASAEDGNKLVMNGRLIEGRTFSMEAMFAHEGGRAFVHHGKYQFHETHTVTMVVVCATDHENKKPDAECDRLLGLIGEPSYERIRETAVMAHRQVFGRVTFELKGDEALERLTTEERLKRFGEGASDPGLQSLLLQMHRYFIICYSKKGGVPGNLSGIWSDETNPAWCCDIHNDTNSQGMYFVADNLDLKGPTDVFFEFFENLMPAARDIARKIYGCRGIFIPITVSCWPECFKVEPGWDEMASCAAWLSEHFWWRYDFYRDIDFLREHAYPFLREAALFYMDYLVPDPRKDSPTYGTLQSFPSYSPENNYIGSNRPVALNASCPFEIELIQELFEHCLEGARILGRPEEELREYQSVLAHLPPIGIDREGRIMEWDEDYPQEEILIHPNDDFGYGHRHISPVIGAFPGDIITRERTPELAEAAYQFLKSRIRYGSGNGGIGGWMGTIFARIGTAEEAQERYRNMIVHGRKGSRELSKLISPSGGMFSTFAATLTEMVLQSHKGYIEILPNLTKEIPDGYVSEIRARGNFSVSIEWEKHCARYIRISSESGGPMKVKYREQMISLETEPGKTYEFDSGLRLLA